jgi:hypothetical protein
MLAKKLRKVIGRDKKIVLDLSDMAQGEVEVIILQKEGRVACGAEEVADLPRHRLGKIWGTLGREEIYRDAR